MYAMQSLATAQASARRRRAPRQKRAARQRPKWTYVHGSHHRVAVQPLPWVSSVCDSTGVTAKAGGAGSCCPTAGRSSPAGSQAENLLGAARHGREQDPHATSPAIIDWTTTKSACPNRSQSASLARCAAQSHLLGHNLTGSPVGTQGSAPGRARLALQPEAHPHQAAWTPGRGAAAAQPRLPSHSGLPHP